LHSALEKSTHDEDSVGAVVDAVCDAAAGSSLPVRTG